VLVLSPPWRTVLVIVVERFACMGSTRLALRSTNRRSQTRGSCSLSPLVYPLPNSRPSSALTRMEYYNRTLDRAREAPHRLPGTDLDPWCGTSKASTVWRQVATAVWRQVATAEDPRCRNGYQHASSWETQGSNLYLSCRRASPNFRTLTPKPPNRCSARLSTYKLKMESNSMVSSHRVNPTMIGFGSSSTGSTGTSTAQPF